MAVCWLSARAYRSSHSFFSKRPDLAGEWLGIAFWNVCDCFCGWVRALIQLDGPQLSMSSLPTSRSRTVRVIKDCGARWGRDPWTRRTVPDEGFCWREDKSAA
jgi:hypothetical protein